MTRQSKNTPTKKKTTVKKTATSKKSLVKKAAPLTWRFYVVTIGIFVVAVTAFIVLALLTAGVVEKNTNQGRLDRIKGIYTSLNISDEYRLERYDVFGDKRPYDWDKNRTTSSVIEYVHGDTVNNTVAELDAKIKAAGFTFIDEPYAGSKQTQYHYKSPEGEYIRLSVSSKPYWDAIANASAMKAEPTAEVYAMDVNAGPALVTLKVNLDDNNE